MLRKNIILVLLLVVAFTHAQKESAIWYFGDKAGLDFNSGTPVPLEDGQLSTLEGCATISDSDGNLLFYTDGVTVWNRNHEIMPNGTELNGHESSTQSSIIVPVPLSPNTYYIFTNDGVSNGLQYSIVDMSAENGLGDIADKNTPLETQIQEKLTAVLHANGSDIWIITHKRSNQFVTYLLKESGLSKDPVISITGTTSGVQGYLKASANGKLLAMVNTSYSNNNNSKAELFRFDNSTGIVSDPINIGPSIINSFVRTPKGPYGLEFSSDSSKLYVSTKALDIDGLTYYLYQFDVSNYNTDAILDSSTIIVKSEDIGIYALQIATDNKIYAAQDNTNYLAVINDPNVLGSASNFQFNAVNLGSGKSGFGLPAFIQSYFINEVLAKNFCLGDATKFSVNASGNNPSVLWDFGDGNSSTSIAPSHTYKQAGNYTVRVTITSSINKISSSKTLTKSVTIYEVPVANTVSDANFCYTENAREFNLSTKNNEILVTQPESDYLINYYSSRSDAADNYNPLPLKYADYTDAETIYARISNINNLDCYDITSFTLHTRFLPEINIESAYYLCPDNPNITIDAGGFESLSWQNSNGNTIGTNRIATINQPGTYTLSIINSFNNGFTCENTIEFEVLPFEIMDDFDIDISPFSSLITLTINTPSNDDFEYSLDGETYQSSNILEVGTGEHTVYIRDLQACKTITKTVTTFGYRPFFTPNGDGINENWHISEIHRYPNSKVSIYDRYGKLLKQLHSKSSGWDGRFNGELLPNSNYWFRFENNGEIHTGHFILKR